MLTRPVRRSPLSGDIVKSRSPEGSTCIRLEPLDERSTLTVAPSLRCRSALMLRAMSVDDMLSALSVDVVSLNWTKCTMSCVDWVVTVSLTSGRTYVTLVPSSSEISALTFSICILPLTPAKKSRNALPYTSDPPRARSLLTTCMFLAAIWRSSFISDSDLASTVPFMLSGLLLQPRMLKSLNVITLLSTGIFSSENLKDVPSIVTLTAVVSKSMYPSKIG